ncbi:uncharacterized protein LOC127255820 isoform X4 [Andrographis paniculata]|uniref:uncharacterized protein LOC127255820 isoform X4 n=1 Tax=Andrographis paniculata TaxID=175694 RepID=UPI0021E73475|nr:uncharacterized protein LOC127255820 isoform X4 [Andrographis paniculata]
MLRQLPSLPFSTSKVSSKGISVGPGEFKITQLPVLRSSFQELKDFSNDVEDRNRLALPSYKWRLIISYDGTRFSGWQYQQSTPTVQCLVEEALTRITKLERDHLGLVGAGRTDAGVHAWGGALQHTFQLRQLGARSRSSEWIYNDTVMDPFQRHFAYHSLYKLNAAAMRSAARHFVGTHNFSAFANASHNDRTPNPVKNIFRFDVTEMGSMLLLEVEGSGFLYRQVRNMVALLIQVGKEAVPVDIVADILASRNRRELAKYALSVPPHGLCLYGVKYNEDHLGRCHPRSFGRNHTITKCKLPFY